MYMKLLYMKNLLTTAIIQGKKDLIDKVSIY